jgi:uncharacterized protein YbjT (DUF2867 family)
VTAADPVEPGADAVKTCLVTGATGYVGGRLVPELLDAGMRVRCMTRSRTRLRDQPWIDRVEVVEGDVSDPRAAAQALRGVDVAYYLIHSMSAGPRFEQADRAAATRFARAAGESGLSRLVYLGGLAPRGEELSPHMRSRAEVGEILLGSGVPTAVLRAAVIIGSGSASFEMLRYLTERLPVMVTPKWVSSKVQPIAIRDVLRYLVRAADLPPQVSRAFDIGGPDVLTYRDMMYRYAEVSGLGDRHVVQVPVLTPSLSSHWIGLVTPVPGTLARPLVESLRHDAVCGDHQIARYIPDPAAGLVGFDDAVRLALQRVREAVLATRWSSGSLPGAPSDPLPTDPDWAGGSLYTDYRERHTTAPAGALWATVEAIGGETGWYSLPSAWEARGLIDRVFGGVGLRRGRRDPRHLRVGDAVDFWRVEELVPGRLLRLRAEMRLPGRAWLELRVDGDTPDTRYSQRALFHPHGLAGQAYWWSVKPFHGLVFGAMARNILRTTEEERPAGRSPPRRPAWQRRQELRIRRGARSSKAAAATVRRAFAGGQAAMQRR